MSGLVAVVTTLGVKTLIFKGIAAEKAQFCLLALYYVTRCGFNRCLSHPEFNHSGSIYYVLALCGSFTYSLQAQNIKIVFILTCSLLEIIFKYHFIVWM